MANSAYISALAQREKENLWVMQVFSSILSRDAPLFSAEEILRFAKDAFISDHDALLCLLSAACGLEPDRSPVHRRLEMEYLSPAVVRLSEKELADNDYVKTVRFPDAALHGWQFARQAYQPFELFPCGSPALQNDGRVLPKIGYFPCSVAFPSVLENGREWMAVKPNEIATMASPVAAAQGRCAVFGLGLGYFAFMAAQKREVKSVFVIERDRAAIELFQTRLLPQFPHREKIRVVQSDAYDFAKRRLNASDFDFAFFDLWHDVFDGVKAYLRLRRMERAYPALSCCYWIEQDILLFLRSLMIDDALHHAGRLDRLLPEDEKRLPHALTLPEIRKIAPRISPEDVE